jgi:predicted flap endonuclease-1-like 5' DNA nuclease
MLFSSPLQLLVLCAVAVVAWLLGFATNPMSVNRGEAMRKLTRDFAAFRAQSQSRLNTLSRHAATLEASHQVMTERLAEAEARIATFRAARHEAPVTPPAPATQEDEPAVDTDASDPVVPPLTPGETAAPPVEMEAFADLTNDPPLHSPAAETVAEPAESQPEPVELGFAGRDLLTRIDGIDTPLALRLYDLGIARFEDIEKLSDQDELALELRLALPGGYITGRQWRQQAAVLRHDDLRTLAARADQPQG